MNNGRRTASDTPPSPDPKRVRRSNSKTPDNETRRPVFTSHHQVPDLPPNVKQLCEIISITPSTTVESVLTDSGIRVSHETVEQVLKLSYSHPGPAVKFFRWSANQLGQKQSPYAWNLVVDMLGKNSQFKAMWDAIGSMKKAGLLSLTTFASVFSTYVVLGKVDEAIGTFEIMEEYGCRKDVFALNSLLSAICRDGRTVEAAEYLKQVKVKIRPDCDSYAILLEGFETEGNVAGSRKVFNEMVDEIGFDPHNVPAYDSYLCTLLKGDGIRDAVTCFRMISSKGCYPGIKFLQLALDECLKVEDVISAEIVWDSMVGRLGLRPDTRLYNAMITLQCFSSNTDMAVKLLDDMIFRRVFPDAYTYNLMFKFLMKARKLTEGLTLFNEMVKNEFVPSHQNCHEAIRVLISTGEPYMAIKIWKCMFENHHQNLADTGNVLVCGLCDMDMLPEAVKYSEGMIERGIELASTSLSKLKRGLTNEKKVSVYEDLLKKIKAR